MKTPKPPDILRKSHRHMQRKERATAKGRLREAAHAAVAELDERSQHEGSCRCGAVTYRYASDIPPSDWSVRTCPCSFCRNHGAVYTSDPAGSVEIIASAADVIRRRRFGLETADFLICERCGDFVAAVTTSETEPRAVVNVNLLDDPPHLPEPCLVEHADETREQRIARHAASWTPLVSGQKR